MSLSLYRLDIIGEFGGFGTTHRISSPGIYCLFPKAGLFTAPRPDTRKCRYSLCWETRASS